MTYVELLFCLRKMSLGDSSYTDLLPGSSEFWAEYCEGINEGKGFSVGKKREREGRQDPWREVSFVQAGGKEGDGWRVKGTPYGHGAWGSHTPGVAHSDQSQGEDGVHGRWRRFLSKQGWSSCKAMVSWLPTLWTPAGPLRFWTKFMLFLGWPWPMIEQGGCTRAQWFPHFHPSLDLSSSPWQTDREISSHHNL